MNTTPRGSHEERASLVTPAERLAWVTILACAIALAMAFWASIASACLMWRAGADALAPAATIVLAPQDVEPDRCSLE